MQTLTVASHLVPVCLPNDPFSDFQNGASGPKNVIFSVLKIDNRLIHGDLTEVLAVEFEASNLQQALCNYEKNC